MDRMAELARELFDEAVRRVEATLGEGPHDLPVRTSALRAARKMAETAVQAAEGAHERAAYERHRTPPPTG